MTIYHFSQCPLQNLCFLSECGLNCCFCSEEDNFVSKHEFSILFTLASLQETPSCSAGLNQSKITTFQAICWRILHSREDKYSAFITKVSVSQILYPRVPSYFLPHYSINSVLSIISVTALMSILEAL